MQQLSPTAGWVQQWGRHEVHRERERAATGAGVGGAGTRKCESETLGWGCLRQILATVQTSAGEAAPEVRQPHVPERLSLFFPKQIHLEEE